MRVVFGAWAVVRSYTEAELVHQVHCFLGDDGCGSGPSRSPSPPTADAV